MCFLYEGMLKIAGFSFERIVEETLVIMTLSYWFRITTNPNNEQLLSNTSEIEKPKLVEEL